MDRGDKGKRCPDGDLWRCAPKKLNALELTRYKTQPMYDLKHLHQWLV